MLGHAVPTLIPKRFTNFLAASLFLFFGAKLLREGYSLRPEQGVSEEMREVEMELEEKEELARKMGRRRSSISPYVLESGRVNTRKTRSNTRLPAPPDSPPSSPDGSRSPSPSRGAMSSFFAGVTNLFSLLLSPAWVQTFVMTFLGEWGDRSQIATIAMAAGQDYWWVTGGAVSGHAFCTAIAVIGGRAIAGRVSLRMGKSLSLTSLPKGFWLTLLISDSWWRIRFPRFWHNISYRSDVYRLRNGLGGLSSIGSAFRALCTTLQGRHCIRLRFTNLHESRYKLVMSFVIVNAHIFPTIFIQLSSTLTQATTTAYATQQNTSSPLTAL